MTSQREWMGPSCAKGPLHSLPSSEGTVLCRALLSAAHTVRLAPSPLPPSTLFPFLSNLT